MAHKRKSRMARSETKAAWLFASPWIIGFIIFTLGPIVASLVLSLTKYEIFAAPKYIGFKNYQTLFFRDKLFIKSLYNTFYITVIGVPLGVITGLSIALLLNMKIRGMSWYRTIYYLPAIVPIVASSILWKWIFRPQVGLMNYVLSWFGIRGPMWLGSIAWAKPAIIIMQTWAAGATMIIYLAGLKGIPVQLYESAEIDGASWFHKFIHITLPMITPTLFFTTVMGMIGSFQIFAQAFFMTQGGPADSTLFYVYYLFNNAFAYFKMGYASAMAWILFWIILILTLLQLSLARYWVYYEAPER